MRAAGVFESKTARVWDAATGKLLVTLAGHEAGVRSVQFSADGTRILTAVARLYCARLERAPAKVRAAAGVVPGFFPLDAQMRLNSDEELEMLKNVDWLALRERLRGVLRLSVNANSPYLRALRRYVRE